LVKGKNGVHITYHGRPDEKLLNDRIYIHTQRLNVRRLSIRRIICMYNNNNNWTKECIMKIAGSNLCHWGNKGNWILVLE